MSAKETQTKIKYSPQYKPNQLICGYGETAIITGWMVRKTVAQKLSENDYAVVGNLYSPTRGISFLIRNLLLNPHVHFLVVINATKEDKNAGGCQCLLDFFKDGYRQGKTETGKDCWLINSKITGYIDIEIDQNSLEILRNNITIKEVNSVELAIEMTKKFASSKINKTWSQPLLFPEQEIITTVLPGVRYGHRIEGKTIAETWIKILHRIKTTGTIRPTGYDGKWQELINLMAIVTDEPDNFYFPEPNYLPIDREFLTEYIGQILDDSPYREGVKYTYGQRLRSWFKKDQIKQIIDKLILEIDSASAVMSLWDVQDHEVGGSPCLNHIWIRVIDKELSLTATLRSNDMFAAWPANAMGLRALQQHIRDEIAKSSDYNLTLAPLITISQSAHIYDDTWENVDSLINSKYQEISQQKSYDDAVGNFLIEVENNQIMVKQTTIGSGEIIKVYQGKNPLNLIREICHTSPAIQPIHIGYIGIELEKAYQCLKNSTIYRQDQ